MPTITLDHVSKYYKLTRQQRRNTGRKRQAGVVDLSLTIQQGEFVFVIGSSGSGKSTLLGLISGDLKPDRGTVLMDDRLVSPRMQGVSIGQVWQDHHLLRRLTVEENLLQAARQASRWESKESCRKRIQKVLGLVGLPGVESKYPVEMAIGDCRRVELAGALINSPHVLVLDELTAGLKDENIWDILHLLTEINRKGTTVIMTTHAARYVNILRRRVITMSNGRIFSDLNKGTYGEVAYIKKKLAPREPKQ